MPDIVHVISDMRVGGAGVLVSRILADAPNEAGSLALLPKGSLLCSLFEERGVPFSTYSARKERSFSVGDVRALGNILSKNVPRLVVSHASLSARVAAKSLGIKTVSVRHCDTEVCPLSVPFYNALTDATVSTSRPLTRRLSRAGIKRVVTIENGYTPVGVPTDAERRAARAAFSLGDGTVAIGLAGRLSPIKGQETALRALSLLGDMRERFTLCFLGEGEDEERLRAIARSLDTEKSVRFLGFRSDARSFYHAMDAHLSCSLGSETSSLSLAEGMSAGCPTFASDTEGNCARVGAGGVVFPVGDAYALSRLLLSLLKEGERVRLGRLAQARAQTLPTWEGVRRAYGSFLGAFCAEMGING